MPRGPFNAFSICFRCIHSNSVLPTHHCSSPETHQEFISGRGRTDGNRDSWVIIVTKLRAEQLRNLVSIPSSG
jgi:hypothetical protein